MRDAAAVVWTPSDLTMRSPSSAWWRPSCPHVTLDAGGLGHVGGAGGWTGTFVVDGAGDVAAKFEVIPGGGELRAAIDEVLGS